MRTTLQLWVMISTLLATLLLTSFCFADTPITSTDFHMAYSDINIIKEAKEKGVLTEQMAHYLLSDPSIVSIDKKAALINALSWDFYGKNNARRFLSVIDSDYYKGALSVGSVNWHNILQKISDELSADTLLCLGYLMLMDDYFDPESAIPILEKAVEKNNRKSFTFMMVLALAKAQHIQKTSLNYNMYLVVKNVIENRSLEIDMRQNAINIIMQYMNLYKEYPRDIDYQWLWKPFEARESFAFYSKPSKTSKQVGKVEKGTILYLLDMIDNDWYLLRETIPTYRKGWVTAEDGTVDYKAAPLCGTLIASEEAYLCGNPHLYYRKDKMPFTTVVADTATNAGVVNDKLIDLTALGYKDTFFLYPEDYTHPEGKEVYAICVGAYKDMDEAKGVKEELENKGYQPFLLDIKETNGRNKIAQNNYMPMLYDKGWKSPANQDIDRKMNEPVINFNTEKPFNFKVIDKKGKEIGRVNTPAEYFNCVRKGNSIDIYTTYDIIDEGIFRKVAMALFYFSKAKPSTYSYVRDFPFDKEDPLSILPVTFINWAGSDQREAIEKATEQGKSWREMAPKARVLKAEEDKLMVYDTFGEDFYSFPEHERYHGNQASNVISPSVLGDFNGDGYEDIALSCSQYNVGGSGRSYYFVVLTRKSPSGVLEDITEKVDKLIF